MEIEGVSGVAIDYRAGDLACQAYVAPPARTGPHPLVLIAPTIRGPTDAERAHADRLAGQGFVAVVIDVYGEAERDLPPERARALMNALIADRVLLRARLFAALAFAKGLEGVDASRVAAIGFCFGGLCVLDLARTGTRELAGVVSFHGVFAPNGLDPAPIAAKLLVLHGYDDPLATPAEMVALADELTAAGADWQILAFGGVGHAFTNKAANDRAGGLFYDERADRRAWAAAERFLGEVLL